MFKLTSEKKGKRTGKIQTKNGVVKTPFFMPDATRGFVKSMSKSDLEEIDMGPMVVNTVTPTKLSQIARKFYTGKNIFTARWVPEME